MRHVLLISLLCILGIILEACGGSSGSSDKSRQVYTYNYTASGCPQEAYSGRFDSLARMCQDLYYQIQPQGCVSTYAQRVFEAKNCHRSDVFQGQNQGQISGPGVFYDYGGQAYINTPKGRVHVDPNANADVNELPIDDGLIYENGIVRKKWQNFYANPVECKAVIDNNLTIDLSVLDNPPCGSEPEGEGGQVYLSPSNKNRTSVNNDINIQIKDGPRIRRNGNTNTTGKLATPPPRAQRRKNTTIKTRPVDDDESPQANKQVTAPDKSLRPKADPRRNTPSTAAAPAGPSKKSPEKTSTTTNTDTKKKQTPTPEPQESEGLDFNMIYFKDNGVVYSEVPSVDSSLRIPLFKVTAQLDNRSPLYKKKHQNGTSALETQLLSPKAGQCEVLSYISSNKNGVAVLTLQIKDNKNTQLIKDCKAWMQTARTEGFEIKTPELATKTGKVSGEFKFLLQKD